jgi:hypothetical protein
VGIDENAKPDHAILIAGYKRGSLWILGLGCPFPFIILRYVKMF